MKLMRFGLWIGVSGCLALSAAGIGLQSSAGGAAKSGIPKGPIVVGLPIALTGDINAYDGAVLVGAQLASAKFNKAGGVRGHKFKLVTADTASLISQSAVAGEEVIAKGAQFILPTIDYDLGEGAARVGQKHNLIVISAADDTRFGLSIGDDVFNLDTGGVTQGAVLARYAYDSLHLKSVYVMRDTSNSANIPTCDGGFGTIFDQLGGNATETSFTQTSQSSIDSAVSTLSADISKVDGVMICANPPDGATLLKQIRAAGVTVPILLGDGFDGNFWETSVPNLANTYTISFGPVTPGQDKVPLASAAFAAAVKAKITITQALGFLEGYSAIQAIADGVQATDSVSANLIRPYFESFKNKPLAIGLTTWTKTCHARAGDPLIIAKFANSEEQFVTNLTPIWNHGKMPADAC